MSKLNPQDVMQDDAEATEQKKPLPLLLIHGFPFSGSLWQPQVEAFSHERMVLTPNLRGFGGTALGEAKTPRLDAYAADLIKLLDAMNIEKAVVGGLSMGGYIALAMWRRYPKRIAALVLADTQAAADTAATRAKRADGIKLVQAQGVATYAESQLPHYFAPSTREVRPHVVQQVREMMLSASVEGITFALQAMASRPDSTPLLPTISVPTLVLHGADDAIIAPIVAEKLAAQIPNAQISVISDAGHISNMEQPATFNQSVAQFLATL